MIQFHSNKFNLTIHITAIDYQYPGQNDNHWDDNWLKMELEISYDEISHKKQDPFLLTWECKELAKWFYNFPHNKLNDFFINLENTLTFTKISTDSFSEDSNLKIQIHKSLIPSSLMNLNIEQITVDKDDDINLYFMLCDKESKIIADHWNQVLDKFPYR